VTFASSLLFGFEDEVTVEPFAALSVGQAYTYGTAVTYQALIQRGAKRVTNPQGREVISNVSVIIPERVHIDQRSRVTLPSGFVPNQPPIIGIEPLKGLGMDHTVVYV
jgi:hypothetical protein